MKRQPKFSFVIASRNDSYCGNSMGRLAETLYVLYRHFEGEVVLVDWGSQQPLGEIFKEEKIRHIYVPPELATPHFNEVLALNVGIRRAAGTYIARLDQDTLPGLIFRQWLFELPDTGWSPAFFSARRDMVEGAGTRVENLIPAKHPRWSEHFNEPSDFFKAAVGVLLAPRDKWHVVRGYDERMIYRCHMEHDLCCRLRRAISLVNLGPIVNYDFYHQFHVPVIGRRDNTQPSEAELNNVPLYYNDETWGLRDVKLQEWNS